MSENNGWTLPLSYQATEAAAKYSGLIKPPIRERAEAIAVEMAEKPGLRRYQKVVMEQHIVQAIIEDQQKTIAALEVSNRKALSQ
jgi:hypothetical protein